MDKIIYVTEKNVYGNPTLYPACELSRLFCLMAQTKQVTPDMVRKAKAAGYSVTVAPTIAKEL